MNDFWSKFKWYLIGGGTLLLVGLVVLVVVLINSGPEEGPMVAAPEANETEDANGTGQRIERVRGQEFKGKGTAKQRFEAGGGLTIITMSYEGQQNQNFIVSTKYGDTFELLANERGSFKGSRALGIPAGDYELEITAVGDWTINVDQSLPTQAPSPPKKLEGEGVQASDFFALEAGPATFKLTHRGGNFFGPRLVKAADGTVVVLLANEQGDFTGDKVVEVAEAGLYLVDVVATGEWEIEVNQ